MIYFLPITIIMICHECARSHPRSHWHETGIDPRHMANPSLATQTIDLHTHTKGAILVPKHLNVYMEKEILHMHTSVIAIT